MARPSKSAARYVLRRDDPAQEQLGGLNWLASRNKNLAHDDGKPHLLRIAEATGLDKGTLSCLMNGHYQLGMQSMAALTRVAMKSGVSRRTAEHHLFDLIEDSEAQAVAA